MEELAISNKKDLSILQGAEFPSNLSKGLFHKLETISKSVNNQIVTEVNNKTQGLEPTANLATLPGPYTEETPKKKVKDLEKEIEYLRNANVKLNYERNQLEEKLRNISSLHKKEVETIAHSASKNDHMLRTSVQLQKDKIEQLQKELLEKSKKVH